MDDANGEAAGTGVHHPATRTTAGNQRVMSPLNSFSKAEATRSCNSREPGVLMKMFTIMPCHVKFSPWVRPRQHFNAADRIHRRSSDNLSNFLAK